MKKLCIIALERTELNFLIMYIIWKASSKNVFIFFKIGKTDEITLIIRNLFTKNYICSTFMYFPQ